MKQIKQTIFLCLLWMIGIGVHAEEIPNNEIWYTSSDGKVVKPYYSHVFGTTIISNTYSNGKGVIKFDNSVTSIGDEAFWMCSGLTSIIIPNSVTSIGDEAFWMCSGLTSITIPNSVTSIGEGAFESCYGLTSITIPNSVTSIGERAFGGCFGLTSITIPNSVTSIGERAFEYCYGLTSITIPNSVTSIGDEAFEYCYGLTSIDIPNSVTSIGGKAFWMCYFSSFVNNSSLDAESNNYWGAKICNNDGLFIEDNIIVDCAKWVTSITIPNSVTSIGDEAFYECTGLTSIDIPNSVTSIGNWAFGGCSGLTSITIPNSVTSIGYRAFESCYGLTSITIPNSVTSIGNWAFSYCSGLTSITIPNSVTSIGYSAFSGCSGLTSITIPNSVTSIGNSAFSGCSGLTSINIPNSVTSIEWSAFNGCSGLTSIIVEDGNPNYDSRDNCNAIIETSTNTLIVGCNNKVIPNSVTSIGELAFSGCSGLTSITIPNSVTSIGSSAFNGCYGLTSIKVCWSNPLSIPTGVFDGVNKTNCILYVPKGRSYLYKGAPTWEEFQNIQEYEDEEYLANKKAFEEYKNAKKADAENLAKKGDSQAVLTLITNAKSAIDALTYDESLSLDDNKKAVDAIISKLESEIKAQRDAEELWANKLAFNTYRNSRMSDADDLAKPDDSQEILDVITKAKNEIEGLEYDENKSLSDNMAAVDAIIKQLKVDLENARIAAGMNGINTSDSNMQIHTLDGKKVDSIVKSGFYIINGVKKYVNGN